MLPTKAYTFQIAANQSYRLPVEGQYFKILSATGPVTVKSDFGQLDSLTTGQGLEKTPFGYLLFTDTSGAPNTVKCLVGDQNFIDAFIGSMTIVAAKAPISGSFVNVNAAVTNASAQLLAANANRQYLLIQNKNATGSIYIVFGAGPATVAAGIQIAPGANYEQSGTVSTQAIFAIGSLANNPDIVTVEG